MFKLKKPLILASNSPRRKELLTKAGFDFTVRVIPTDESFPPDLHRSLVAAHISQTKAEEFRSAADDSLVLTADTIVVIDNQILGKPADAAEACEMLAMLSGTVHEVFTAISILDGAQISTVTDSARVWFRQLEPGEINYYVREFSPFDKAGAYGIQEWISMIGIEKIEGSFYTIMGLPVHLVYQQLKPYLAD
ncbi:dTTP/UTP pyrophosphatase [Dyadobacter sp. CECT 9275]|uniref:dTTP/UTP pyrophosphatase n=1 Tax=Dyadobacter helix TaxID=2822344 RepID=A0A916NBH2_9BACT|nr:Maf family nucleotide pyrophosphatase [Dyadobacter sp. CECT 9275]CAG4994442.1 dTTP/UTP pyrophosphatase [Dyadobacter sp. CECT 9275]